MYNTNICEIDYAMWKQRGIIADCFNDLAMKVQGEPANLGIFQDYIAILRDAATKLEHNDVLDKLASHGLLLGLG